MTKHFLCKLVPPRSTFAFDMTETEATFMQQHVGYWQRLSDQGIAVIFGPVLDPTGVWGLGIVEAADEPEVHALGEQDPIMKSGLGFRFEVYDRRQETGDRRQELQEFRSSGFRILQGRQNFRFCNS